MCKVEVANVHEVLYDAEKRLSAGKSVPLFVCFKTVVQVDGLVKCIRLPEPMKVASFHGSRTHQKVQGIPEHEWDRDGKPCEIMSQ